MATRKQTEAAAQAKRKAEEDAAAAAPKPPPGKRRRLPAGYYKTPGETESAEVAEWSVEMDSREFWDQFNTATLWAWAHSIGCGVEPKADQRDAILSWLVLEKAAFPAAGTGGKEQLLTALRQAHDRFSTKAFTSDNDVFGRTRIQTRPPTPPPTVSKIPTTATKQAPKAPTEQALEEPTDEGDLHDVSRLFQCRTCLESIPDRTRAGLAWICSLCGLRGDLPSDCAANINLAGVRARAAPAASSRSPPAAAAAGTPTALAPPAPPAPVLLDARDKAYKSWAEAGPPFPLFDDRTPQTPDQAIAVSMSAYGSSAYHRPSEQLVAFIRSGKMDHAGHAVPRKLDARAQAEASIAEQILAIGMAPSAAATAPTELSDPSVLALALVSTIIPALIDRPLAIMQWCAITRAALHISAEGGWGKARTFCQQMMAERIPQRREFASPSQGVLTTVSTSFAAGRTGPPAAPTFAPHTPCRAWNSTGACPFAAMPNGCAKAHICSACGGQHRQPECRDPRFRQQPRPYMGGGSQRGGRGGRGGGPGARSFSGGSVATAPNNSPMGSGGSAPGAAGGR